MPAKMTRSVPSAAVRAARRAGSHPHLAWVLREGQKSARIHAPSGVIWGIPNNDSSPGQCRAALRLRAAMIFGFRYHKAHFLICLFLVVSRASRC